MHLQAIREHLREYRDDVVFWHRRRTQHGLLPSLLPQDRPIVDSLLRDGVCVTSLSALDLDGTAAMVAAAGQLCAGLIERSPVKGGFCVHANTDEIEAYPDLIRWGLNERLLAIVRHYLQLPVRYRGLTVRRDLKGGAQVETRLWHRDAEDKRIVKVIVYLNDVDRGGGAFEFIPRSFSPPTWRAHRASGRLDERDMEALVPRERWRMCSGPRGTAVIVDTCSVYHRGQVAEVEDRQALFFCYNSNRPLQPMHCAPLFDWRRLGEGVRALTDQQRAAIGC